MIEDVTHSLHDWEDFWYNSTTSTSGTVSLDSPVDVCHSNNMEKQSMISLPNPTKKILMTDNIVDRDVLQQNLIDQIVDDMDLKTLMQLVAEQLDHNYDAYTVDELIAEAEEYYPHLLEQEEHNFSELEAQCNDYGVGK
tara:strand:- start:1193 stop:1609 length:417 start_codon:yes stop_codon:yes gene_type:complete